MVVSMSAPANEGSSRRPTASSMRTPQRTVRLVVAFGVDAVILVTALALPISQEASGYTLVGFQLYSFEAAELFGNASWLNFTYRGVTFEFHLWCLAGPAAGEICGNATEADGHRYSFSVWDGPPTLEPRWETWVSPDAHEAVQYQQGGLAHLLVAW
jgi:hypothetical protein